jgi:hypothetical protein
MNKFEKEKDALDGRGEKDVKWITNKGAHVPVKKGQTVSEATKEYFASKKPTKSKSLSEQIDDVLSGNYRGSHVTLYEETPQTLQDIGVPNKPILITAKHAYLIINAEGKFSSEKNHYHNFGKDLFISVVQLLQKPILVFQNKDYDNEIVAVVNAIDKKKNLIIVPMRINATGNKDFIEIDTNLVKTIYGKENFQNYIDRNVDGSNLLLFENKKIRNFTPRP